MVRAHTVSPADGITILFGDHPAQPTKTRSRQHLSADDKIDSAFAALEGVHAARTLLLAAIKPAAASSYQAMDLVVNCLDFAAQKWRAAPPPWNWLAQTLPPKHVPTTLIES